MSRKISDQLRNRVKDRASDKCEYCRLPQEFALFPFEVDHIIAIKHGGETVIENLALACLKCNRLKGTDLTTVLTVDSAPVRLFHPRKDDWFDHFEVSEGEIVGLTEIGKGTIKLMDFNSYERITARKMLSELDLFP